VQEAAVPILTTWQNFYVIIGSSAGALTGLMFVVITLIAGSRVRRASEPIAAFGTPNVVHFCAALLVVAAIMLPGNPAPALFVTGAATVLLLFIGIHNAWDTVTYVVLEQSQPENKSQD
jgi:hypothetical protein